MQHSVASTQTMKGEITHVALKGKLQEDDDTIVNVKGRGTFTKLLLVSSAANGANTQLDVFKHKSETRKCHRRLFITQVIVRSDKMEQKSLLDQR